MEITTKPARQAATVRVRTPMEGLKEELAKGYGEIAAALGRQGIQPSGVPFAIYHNMDMQDLDVEMGFPVGSAIKPEGRVQPSSLPGGRTAVHIHKGPYETCAATYKQLFAWIAEHHKKIAGPITVTNPTKQSSPVTSAPVLE